MPTAVLSSSKKNILAMKHLWHYHRAYLLNPPLYQLKRVNFIQTQSPQSKFDRVPLSRWSFHLKNDSSNIAKTTSDSLTNKKNKKWSSYSLPKIDASMEHKEIISTQFFKQEQEVTTMTKKPKRSLKPRKALITLSEKAITHLKTLLNQPEPKLIRISVKNRGCSGLVYDLQYITKPEKFDEIVEQNGVKVVIDSKALFSIVGSEMDWMDDKLSSRFVFKNPNSKGTCGCGESFMV